MEVKFFDYPLQFARYRDEYMRIIEDVLSRGAYILCEDVERFEEDLASFTGSRYAVGVGNCTDALLLSLWAAGVGPGDEVICVAHTFVATVEVVHFLGAKPVFVDISDDHNMDVTLVESAVTERTKAIVPVHLNGHICTGMDRLMDLARRRGLVVIEDAAQSLGATWKGKGAGTFGLAGCFSFYPAKLLGTFGDAGAVITDDEHFARKLKLLRDHGREGTEVRMWGLNCRLDNLHAAILRWKLKRLPEWIERRRKIAAMYHEGLKDVEELALPEPPVTDGEFYDVFQNYEIEAERRDELVVHLADKGVKAALPWGGKAVHQFDALGLAGVSLPRTEELFRKVLMLPLYPELPDEAVRYVIDCVRGFYGAG